MRLVSLGDSKVTEVILNYSNEVRTSGFQRLVNQLNLCCVRAGVN
jgi:hypothetical protein